MNGSKQSILLLIISIALSSYVQSISYPKAFCDESLLDEMEAIEKKLPSKLAREAVVCVVTNSTEEGGDLDIECNITKKEEAKKYALLFKDSTLLADCFMDALEIVDKDLTQEEKQKVDKLMEELQEVYDRIKNMQDSGN